MSTTYAQRQTTAQKKDASSASSVLDNSSQSESLQRKADMANNATQRAEAPRPNNTGMPDNLKSGIESLSGFSMDDVRVHYNSSKPATVQALAYTQGTDIHVAPGQEKHLPHEAWHVAQQMAGRVSPTTNINGMPVNDNAALEHEADVMGENAVGQRVEKVDVSNRKCNYNSGNTCQMLRVINAYANLQPKNLEIASEMKKNTDDLRKKYEDKAYRLLVLYMSIKDDSPLKAFFQYNLARYVPHLDASSDYQSIREEIKKRINEEVLSTEMPFLEKNEDLVINGHGNGVFFAGSTADSLAEKVLPLLPNGYFGEIYLEGCCSGKKNENGEMFIEKFYDSLIDKGEKQVPPKVLNPSIKGNKDLSSPTRNGVYVFAGEKIKSTKVSLLKNGLFWYCRGKTAKSHLTPNPLSKKIMVRVPWESLEVKPQNIRMLPLNVIAQLPLDVIAQLPLDVITQLPLNVIAQLRPNVIAQLSPDVRSRLPQFDELPPSLDAIAQLPPNEIAKLPLDVITQLPLDVIAQLPLNDIAKLPWEFLRSDKAIEKLKPLLKQIFLGRKEENDKFIIPSEFIDRIPPVIRTFFLAEFSNPVDKVIKVDKSEFHSMLEKLSKLYMAHLLREEHIRMVPLPSSTASGPSELPNVNIEIPIPLHVIKYMRDNELVEYLNFIENLPEKLRKQIEDSLCEIDCMGMDEDKLLAELGEPDASSSASSDSESEALNASSSASPDSESEALNASSSASLD